MKCPKCGDVEMKEEAVGGAPTGGVAPVEVAVDRCPACHGIWFDMLELEGDPRALLAEDRCFHAQPKEAGPESSVSLHDRYPVDSTFCKQFVSRLIRPNRKQR